MSRRPPNCRRRSFLSVGLIATTMLLAFMPVQTLPGQNPKTQATPDPDGIAAQVGDFDVLMSDLNREVAKIVADQQPDEQAMRLIGATALRELVKRQLVMNHLKRQGYLPNATQLQIRVDLFEEGLSQRQATLQEYLAEQGLSEAKFREAISWNMGWQKYLEKYLTDENLETFFDRHRANFDGTRVHAAHILLKVADNASPEDWEKAIAQLETVRQSIVTAKLTFAEAAKEFSQATTAETGGDIGMIERHQPMPESFSAAAFALKVGETSQPIRTAFGVHLIHCLNIEQGQESWKSVRAELVPATRKYLFEWLAEKESEKIAVAYEQGLPHFEQGTNKIVE